MALVRPASGQSVVGRRARVLNVSTKGIGLRLGHRYPVDTTLTIILVGFPFEAFTGKVVHCVSNGSEWVYGCRLTEALGPEKMRLVMSWASFMEAPLGLIPGGAIPRPSSQGEAVQRV
jgi:hypothetical protein